MYPDDRVLVGVINRKRDLDYFLKAQWYRVPQHRFPQGIFTEYVAIYLSGYPARKLGQGGITYYASLAGIELAYRRDLLPEEAEHQRANDTYYQLQVRDIEGRTPPITNPTKRPISFIFTTWDRFTQAQVIADLYSTADYFVDRIYHALRDRRIRSQRYWDAQRKETGYGAGFRIVCERGVLNAHTDASDDDTVFNLDLARNEDDILREIEARIASMGGVVTLPVPPNES